MIVKRLAGSAKAAVIVVAVALLIVAAVVEPAGLVHAVKACAGGIAYGASHFWAWCVQFVHLLFD